jgi:hypothetical protein
LDGGAGLRHADGQGSAAGRAEGNHHMIDTDAEIESTLGPDEGPARFNRRRVIRWVAILTIGILVVLAVWQEPLYAELG